MLKLHKLTLLAVLIISVITASTATIQPRIIGGSAVDIARHPYLVSIRYKSAVTEAFWHKCAGAIYTDRVIITAAQCIMNSDRIMVVAGANTRTGVDGMQYPVAKGIAHPNYSSMTIDYDVGVLILEIPLDFSKFEVKPISIRSNRPAVGKLGTIAGWGYREEYGPSSYQLEQTQVPIVSDAECVSIYGALDKTDRMICAGYVANGGKDACQGDTGGPLVLEGELIGMVSWGRGCARPGYPGVYTYVNAVKQWIDDTIAANVK